MAHRLLEEKEIFNRARQTAAPEERLACLQEACGHDPAAMHRILELLRVYEEERSFLEARGAPQHPRCGSLPQQSV
jgi:hypothetical protein